MTPWLAAVLALLLPLAVGCWRGMRGGVAERLIAVEFASVLMVQVLVLMSFAFNQQSLIDLALAVGLLSVPGMLLFAHFVERWL